MLIALTLALQTRAAALAQDAPPRHPAPITAFIDSVRREEQAFLIQWRKAWQANTDLGDAEERHWSIHCHFDQAGLDDSLWIITNSASRKSMCPVWLRSATTRLDEAASIDNGLPRDSVPAIRRRRAAVLTLLDSAAFLEPGDRWITGQRVRLNVDQRNYDRANLIARKQCWAGATFCALMRGYVRFSQADRVGSIATFDSAAAVLSESDRCRLLAVSVFLPKDDRAWYRKQSCEDRAAIDERFWWLADPLFADPGNERLAIHLYRWTLILLHSGLTADEHFDWRPEKGGAATHEMILRYGWPSVSYFDAAEDSSHQDWLQFKDSASNGSREYTWPRYHTTPRLALAQDAGRLRNADLSDLGPAPGADRGTVEDEWWAVEHFPHAYLGTFDYQSVQFRRERGPLVALVADARSAAIPAAAMASYTASLVAMSGPHDSMRTSSGPAATRADGATMLALHTTPGAQVISAEVMNAERDSAPAERARFALDGLPGLETLTPGDAALSEVALFKAPLTEDSLPRGAPDAIERMLPSTTLHAPRRVGVFFETYGIPVADSVQLTFTMTKREHPGLLKRIGQRLGMADTTSTSVSVHWAGSQPNTATRSTVMGGVVVQARSIVLDLSALGAGEYILDIAAGRVGHRSVVTRRDITIDR